MTSWAGLIMVKLNHQGRQRYERSDRHDGRVGRDDVRIMTLQSHILAEQDPHTHAGGTFSWIMSALSISAKIISDKVRRARLENVLGSVGAGTCR